MDEDPSAAPRHHLLLLGEPAAAACWSHRRLTGGGPGPARSWEGSDWVCVFMLRLGLYSALNGRGATVQFARDGARWRQQLRASGRQGENMHAGSPRRWLLLLGSTNFRIDQSKLSEHAGVIAAPRK